MGFDRNLLTFQIEILNAGNFYSKIDPDNKVYFKKEAMK